MPDHLLWRFDFAKYGASGPWQIGPQANLALVGLPSLLQRSTCLSSVLTWDGGRVCVVEGGGREWVELTDRESQCCSFSDTANRGLEISRCQTIVAIYMDRHRSQGSNGTCFLSRQIPCLTAIQQQSHRAPCHTDAVTTFSSLQSHNLFAAPPLIRVELWPRLKGVL